MTISFALPRRKQVSNTSLYHFNTGNFAMAPDLALPIMRTDSPASLCQLVEPWSLMYGWIKGPNGKVCWPLARQILLSAGALCIPGIVAFRTRPPDVI